MEKGDYNHPREQYECKIGTSKERKIGKRRSKRCSTKYDPKIHKENVRIENIEIF